MNEKENMIKIDFSGTRVAQLVKRLVSDLSLGLDLRIMGSSPTLGSMLGMEAAFLKNLSLICFYFLFGDITLSFSPSSSFCIRDYELWKI